MLIYSSEERWNALSKEEADTIMQGHYAVREKSMAAGHLRGGNRLLDTISATTEVVAKRESKSRPDAGIVDLEHKGYKQDGELVAICRRQAFMRKTPESA